MRRRRHNVARTSSYCRLAQSATTPGRRARGTRAGRREERRRCETALQCDQHDSKRARGVGAIVSHSNGDGPRRAPRRCLTIGTWRAWRAPPSAARCHCAQGCATRRLSRAIVIVHIVHRVRLCPHRGVCPNVVVARKFDENCSRLAGSGAQDQRLPLHACSGLLDCRRSTPPPPLKRRRGGSGAPQNLRLRYYDTTMCETPNKGRDWGTQLLPSASIH